MKKNVILLRKRHEFLKKIYEPFWLSTKFDQNALLKLADQYDIAPSHVARSVLQEYYTQNPVPEEFVLPPPSSKIANLTFTPVGVLYEFLSKNALKNKWTVTMVDNSYFKAQIQINKEIFEGVYRRNSAYVNAMNVTKCLILVPIPIQSKFARPRNLYEVENDSRFLKEIARKRYAKSKRKSKNYAAYKTLQHFRDELDAVSAGKLHYLRDEYGTDDTDVENGLRNLELPSQLEDTDEKSSDEPTLTYASKKAIATWIREPHKIPNRSLCQPVALCIANDCECGPIGTAIANSIGQEYEYLLDQKAKHHKLVYKDESTLRRLGFDKTPDLKLDVPIAVDGKVVNWIESKAMFGDDIRHTKYLNEQLWSYWNRFGPGMVIYWFGHVNDLEDNTDKGILVSTDFPEHFVTMKTSL